MQARQVGTWTSEEASKARRRHLLIYAEEGGGGGGWTARHFLSFFLVRLDPFASLALKASQTEYEKRRWAGVKSALSDCKCALVVFLAGPPKTNLAFA